MAQAQQTNLMPVPTSVSLNKENYRLTDNFTIKITGLADKRLYKEASRFMQRLSEKTGLFFKTWETRKTRITFCFSSQLCPSEENELESSKMTWHSSWTMKLLSQVRDNP